MRRDLILGVLISAIIHAAAFFGDRLIPEKQKVVKVEEKAPAIEITEPPKVEPDEPEPVDTVASDEPVKPMDFAPPTQTDMPQLVTDTSFVQKIQPPPPENVKVSSSMMAIPANRDMSQFKGMQVFDLASLDQQPVPRVRTPPQYPFEMRRSGTTGEVMVDFIVDPDGNVQNAYALRSTQREFEAPAVAAVSKWKFKAGRKGGRAVPVHMQVPIVFQLNEDQ